MISLNKDQCNQWIIKLLCSSGMAREASELAADIFIRASLRNTEHHDITYLPGRLKLLNQGKINPEGTMELLFETPVFSRFDGHGALGEYCCSYLLNHSIKRAKNFGMAMGTVRRSNHFLAGHPYGQIAAENGCMALVWSNTDPCMGDSNSEAAVIGNNPIGFGAPAPENPMVVDLCMAYTSLGNLGERIKKNQEIPPYWGRNSKGEPTADPYELLNEGVCSPMGDHKGFGLALINELMTSGLSGGEMGPRVIPKGGWQAHSQTILVISLEKVEAQQDWNRRMGEFRRDINEKLTQPIRLPGDNLYRTSRENGNSLKILEKTYQRLSEYSRDRDIPVPEPRA